MWWTCFVTRMPFSGKAARVCAQNERSCYISRRCRPVRSRRIGAAPLQRDHHLLSGAHSIFVIPAASFAACSRLVPDMVGCRSTFECKRFQYNTPASERHPGAGSWQCLVWRCLLPACHSAGPRPIRRPLGVLLRCHGSVVAGVPMTMFPEVHSRRKR